MEKKNQLASTLRTIQKESGKSQVEFSKELGIPRSTIQSMLSDGNATLDTLIRISNATQLSLDELVFGESASKSIDQLTSLLQKFDFYARLSPDKQSECHRLVVAILELLRNENN